MARLRPGGGERSDGLVRQCHHRPHDGRPLRKPSVPEETFGGVHEEPVV